MKRNALHRKTLPILVASALLLSFAFFADLRDVKAQGPLSRPQTWVDGELFDGVVTSAVFKPTAGLFDELFTGGNGFLDGAPLISDAGPGDTNYNGGRWHLNVLRDDVGPDKYANASSVEDLDLDDFMPTDVYFECPLIARRGKR